MKRDTLGTLRARIAELEEERLSWQQLHSTLFAEKNQWFAEAAKQATRADKATRRAEELGRNHYPHMCRDDHPQIGHSDSENERCPLCRANDDAGVWRERAEVAEAALREIVACPDGNSKTWPQIDAIVRRVVEGQESTNAKR